MCNAREISLLVCLISLNMCCYPIPQSSQALSWSASWVWPHYDWCLALSQLLYEYGDKDRFTQTLIHQVTSCCILSKPRIKSITRQAWTVSAMLEEMSELLGHTIFYFYVYMKYIALYKNITGISVPSLVGFYTFKI